MAKQSDDNLKSPFPFRWAAATDIGKVRDENQDSFLANPDLALFLVSDGMGGHRAGARASKIVAEALPAIIEDRLKKIKSSSTRAIKHMLKNSIVELNRHMLTEAASEAGLRGMGATVVAAILINGRAYIANMGDSRLYLLRRDKLLLLTEDHSAVWELLQQGRIRPADCENHSEQGQLTRYIGMEEKAEPYVRTISVKTADRFLLTTDGLTDVINEQTIAAMLSSNVDCRTACDALIDAANAAGGHDNITAVIIDPHSPD